MSNSTKACHYASVALGKLRPADLLVEIVKRNTYIYFTDRDCRCNTCAFHECLRGARLVSTPQGFMHISSMLLKATVMMTTGSR